MRRWLKKINEHAENQNYPYRGYALFQLISNPIFFLIWLYLDLQTYENLFIRIGISFICLPLLLINYWPLKIRKFLPIYWYFSLLYTLVFFFTFMLLKNNLNFMWSLNSLSGVVLWILLIDYKVLAILTPVGILLALISFYFTTTNFYLPVDDLKVIITTYSAILIFGYIFSHRSDKFHKQKLQDLNAQSGAIAHEMRTPLANILMNSQMLEKSAEKMEKAQEAEVIQKDRVLESESRALKEAAQRLTRIAKGNQNLINLLLGNLRQDFESVPQTLLSMRQCLNHALKEFAFKPNEESKVHIQGIEDFQFRGNEELMTHVFFNLFKNSLYFIHASGKGEIFIALSETGQHNQLEFKDTGPGIESHRLSQLFKPFYSRRPHGTGIGLSFCKKTIESFGGNITVESTFGEHTTFKIQLPKLNP